MLTPTQYIALKAELLNDPLGLGYNAASGSVAPIVTEIDFVRDGETPCPANGVIGPGGNVLGATNASPIVIQTDAPHGRVTGDTVVIDAVGGNTAANNVPVSPYGGSTVAPNPSWTITVVDSTHFSLNNSTGNAAYTSGGTWNWCIAAVAGAKIFTQSVSTMEVVQNIAPGDLATINNTQQTILAAILNPSGSVQLTDPLGNETNIAAWLALLTTAGTVSHKAIKALETRFGSRAEQLFGVGVVLTVTDIDYALNH